MIPQELEFTQQVATTSTNRTINEFHRYLATGVLVLRPPFQRNLVWNQAQRSFLIDSVLRGLPIPEVYIQSSVTAEGEERVIVVDGQQRISACLGFLRGELRLVDEDDLDTRWRGKTFSEIGRKLQKRFRSYELLVRKLPELGEPALREIFRRLNKTVEPLVAQELRHAAYTGPFLQFVEAAGSEDVLTEVGVFSPRDYLRRRSDELMAEIAFALVSSAYPNKKEGLDELFLAYERHGIAPELLDALVARFGRVFAALEPIAGRLRRTRFRNKSDFYTLFVVLARNAEVLPLPDDGAERLLAALQRFSMLVNEMKRNEQDQRIVRRLRSRSNGRRAGSYLRAVERAATDRLSRVRREDALEAVLSPVLARGTVRPLRASDAAWMTAPSVANAVDDDEDDDVDERAHLQDILTTDG